MTDRDVRRFLTLFTFGRKAALERYARGVVLRQDVFAAFVVTCKRGLLPFAHKAHFTNVPATQHLPSEKELRDLARGGVGPHPPERRSTLRKLGLMFREHYWSAGHMFYTPGLYEGHFFAFDKRDQAAFAGHWTGGPHVHFVNWLWPHLKPEVVWKRFVEKNEKPGSSLHIRDAGEGAA